MRKILSVLFCCFVCCVTTSAQDDMAISDRPADYKAPKVSYDDSFTKWRFGGYGEINYTHMDYAKNRFTGATYGNARDDRSAVAIPRFVLAGDYKFNKWWQLGAEVEFESGGTGTAAEVETGSGSENGEVEIEYEKGGEVAIEQFHVTATLLRELNLRVGHFVVPVGLLNEHHEPLNFFGTKRPEGECAIVPTTWHETGAEVFGSIGRGWYDFSYQAQMVAGLTVDGFSTDHFISESSQRLFEEDVFTAPAYVGRVNYNGVPGLRVGASVYYLDDAGKNSRKPYYYTNYKVSVTVLSADVEYKHKYFIVRGNYLQAEVGDYDKLTSANIGLLAKSGQTELYSGKTPIASKGLTYGGELGINVGQVISSVFSLRHPVAIYPFARYEYYNPFYDGTKNALASVARRQEVSMWTVGINWMPIPTLVLKADWTMRHIGTQHVFRDNGGFNSENDFSIGVAYAGWFAKK